MFSKAKGSVAIAPKYVPAKDSKDSYIFFRLRCNYTINSRPVTEFYTIKAFGKVADFLNDHVKKDSEVYVEAIARSKRYTENGQDTIRYEYHVFKARDIATNHVVDTRIKENMVHDELSSPDSSISPKTAVQSGQSQQVSNRSTCSPEHKANLEAELAWQKMTHDDAKKIASKWRSLFEEQKALSEANNNCIVNGELIPDDQLAPPQPRTGWNVMHTSVNCSPKPEIISSTANISEEESISKNLLAARAYLKIAQRSTVQQNQQR